jgi:hypothetical protein
MRGRGVGGHETEGRARNRGDDIASEGRGNAPPNCPGKHCVVVMFEVGGGGEVLVRLVGNRKVHQELPRQKSEIHNSTTYALTLQHNQAPIPSVNKSILIVSSFADFHRNCCRGGSILKHVLSCLVCRVALAFPVRFADWKELSSQVRCTNADSLNLQSSQPYATFC